MLGRQGWRTGRGGGSIELQRAWLGLGVGVGVELRLRVRAAACKYYLQLTTHYLLLTIGGVEVEDHVTQQSAAAVMVV